MLCLPAVQRKRHITQLYNSLDLWGAHSVIFLSPLRTTGSRPLAAAAGMCWRQKKAGWTQARACTCTPHLAHEMFRPAPSSRARLFVRSGRSRLRDEPRQAVMRKVRARMDREHGVLWKKRARRRCHSLRLNSQRLCGCGVAERTVSWAARGYGISAQQW